MAGTYGAEWSGLKLKVFSPLHVEHIADYLPEVVEYLDLPPGYRFYIDGSNFEDAWLDPELVRT